MPKLQTCFYLNNALPGFTHGYFFTLRRFILKSLLGISAEVESEILTPSGRMQPLAVGLQDFLKQIRHFPSSSFGQTQFIGPLYFRESATEASSGRQITSPQIF
ncbi:MAG: hypothetical protein WCO84_08185 [bacterium]